MTEIDVRKSRSYSYVQGASDSSNFRFRVTDDCYLNLNAKVGYYTNDEVNVYVRITPDNSSEFVFKVTLSYEHSYGNMSGTSTYTFSQNVAEMPLFHVGKRKEAFRGFFLKKGEERKIDLTFRFIRTIPESYYMDFKNFLSVQDVTLTASDGQVKANMILLKMRSPAFCAMFDMETSKEFQTKTVDMTHVKKDVLVAFVEFLFKEELVNADQTACDLFKLGNMFIVPSLVTASQKYLMENTTKENAREMYRLFEPYPKLLEELIDQVLAKLNK